MSTGPVNVFLDAGVGEENVAQGTADQVQRGGEGRGALQ